MTMHEAAVRLTQGVGQRLEQVFLIHRITPPVPAVEANSLSSILSTVRVTDCLGVAPARRSSRRAPGALSESI